MGVYLIAQMDLLAEMCMDRNYTVINMIKDKFAFSMLLAIIEGPRLDFSEPW